MANEQIRGSDLDVFDALEKKKEAPDVLELEAGGAGDEETDAIFPDDKPARAIPHAAPAAPPPRATSDSAAPPPVSRPISLPPSILAANPFAGFAATSSSVAPPAPRSLPPPPVSAPPPPPRMPADAPASLPAVPVVPSVAAPVAPPASRRTPPPASPAPLSTPVSPPQADSYPPARSLVPTVLIDQERISRRPPMVAAALCLVAVLVLGAGIYIAIPRSGQLAVNVTDAHGQPVDHVKVFVDGKEACESAPCIQTENAGVHQVRVVADGYEPPADQAIAIGAGKPATATFALAASAGATTAKAAEIAAVGSQPPSTDHQGAEPVRQASEPGEPSDQRAPAAASTPPSRIDAKPVGASSPSPEGNAGAVAYRPPPSSGGDGFLNINSIPSSNCFLDGRSLGSTPRLHVSVRAGTHVIKFVNADEGLTKVVTVHVGGGETKAAIARLK